MFTKAKIHQVYPRIGTLLVAGSLLQILKSRPAHNDQNPQIHTDTSQLTKSRRYKKLDGYDLKMVQILIRHGARTPLHVIEGVDEVPYCKDFLTRLLPHTDFHYKAVDLAGGPAPFSSYDLRYINKILKGGATYGVLTTTGQEQAYVLGQLLKQHYIQEAGLIDDTFNPDQVHVRSTNCSRTRDTARCILAGMYGSKNLNTLVEPARIHIETFFRDPLVPGSGTCRVFRTLSRAARQQRPQLPDMREDIQVIERLFGLNPTSSTKVNFEHMHDDIVVREAHGFVIPDIVKPYRDMIVRNAITLKHSAYCGHHEAERELVTRLSAGRIVTMLVDNMDKTEERSTRLFIYSCHDSTLVSVLGGLGLFDDVWPPFTADLRLELYENEEKQKFVRLTYNNEDKIMPGASSELCPLEDFKAAVSWLMLPDTEYWKLCDSDILEQIHVAEDVDETEDADDDEDIPAGL